MKLRAIQSAFFAKRLRAAAPQLAEAVVEAAASALHAEAKPGAEALAIEKQGARSVVGSNDPVDAAREFGTLDQPPSPWLAPVLPLALEPMRAAARTAAARAVSQFGNRKK
ncbi:MAG: hypothetical protein KF826_13430 [Xanthobacteraceae bacterium]|nr:hypothetical protein [Xanthobacteraceae bacterium]MBX3535346.1 hypothetical protein [Xanthobacteraceae bacterium]MCW5674139.1 hypothetical protein [Xanthobacteraceae bacterium]MCW5678050.1 hypothetical protein [Xanthobacteraceae bacterium]